MRTPPTVRSSSTASTGTPEPKPSPLSSASTKRSRIARRSPTASSVSPKATPYSLQASEQRSEGSQATPEADRQSHHPMVETYGHTHQLLIFEHKHKITNSKFEKKQALRERKRESWIWKERRKTKIQTQIEQVMDLERTKKMKYKMRVNESRPWLG